MAAPDEKTPLQEAEPSDGPCNIGNFILFRKIGSIGLPVLQKNRQQVLRVSHYVCLTSLLFTVAATVGAFASKTLLSYLSWVTVKTPNGIANAGVRWVCYDIPSENGGMQWKCEPWSEFDCSHSPLPDACALCKHEAIHLTLTMMVAIFTFYTCYKKTDERMKGKDSNFTKFTVITNALIGGANFSLAIWAYWQSCILSSLAGTTTASPGLGLWCISVAAVLKVLVGVISVGVPVDKSAVKDVV
mmetsp:Transcript_73061/g.138108  ORF Transcript_73061/g.138108 Transcript_73061/m.138108 type:complete len:244 (+) Transcript_73061:87-818(+)